MNTKLAAFVIFVFAVYFLAMTFKTYKRNHLSTRIFLMWSFIWIIIGIGSLFPSLADKLMTFVNMGIRMNFILLSAILFLFIMMFYMSSNIINSSRKIIKLIQQLSILNYRLEKLEKYLENDQCNNHNAHHSSEDKHPE